MGYKVFITAEAEDDLERIIQYIVFEKQNFQAASNILEDFELTKNKLKTSAKALKFCNNQKLKNLGYRRINFQNHKYFMLYRVKDNIVFIDSIFHELQDYENKVN